MLLDNDWLNETIERFGDFNDKTKLSYASVSCVIYVCVRKYTAELMRLAHVIHTLV